ncbi:MAG TPA: hypothetical protein VLA34_13535, partial [Candidatus Krumholzibacterium sp.]|nr:hypothetical protein [Candidatus Krumholzibacterium sp.]
LDGDRERYQVRLKISNPEDSGGLMEIRFRRKRGPGGRGGFMRRMMGQREDEEDELRSQISMDRNQNLELGFVLDYEPGSIEINTLISRNIPSVITESFGDFELDKKATPFEGRRELDEVVRLEEPGEIVVDNEDPGFRAEVKETRSFIKRLLPGQGIDEDEKYHGMVYWRNSPRWLPTTNSKFYGRYVRSAHFTNNGKGDRKVSWSAELEESGFYDVYCHIAKIAPPWRHRGDEQEYGTNQYLIHHDDGIEDTDIELDSAEDGWNFLGSYYISGGTAVIEMTNKSEKGRFVTADAVKWVKR